MQWLRWMSGCEGGAFPYGAAIRLMMVLALLAIAFLVFRIGAAMLEKVASDPSHVISKPDGWHKILRFAPGVFVASYGGYLTYWVFSIAATFVHP